MDKGEFGGRKSSLPLTYQKGGSTMKSRKWARILLRSVFLCISIMVIYKMVKPLIFEARHDTLQAIPNVASQAVVPSGKESQEKKEVKVDQNTHQMLLTLPPFVGKVAKDEPKASVEDANDEHLDFEHISWPPSPPEELPLTLGSFEDTLETHLPRDRPVVSNRLLRQMTRKDSSVPLYRFLGSDEVISNNAFDGFPVILPELLDRSIDIDETNDYGERRSVVDTLDKQYSQANRVRDAMTGLLKFHPKMKNLRANACILIFCNNKDLTKLMKTLSELEFVFNKQYGYDYVFLSEESLSEHFKKLVLSSISTKAQFGLIPKEEWDLPPNIDKDILMERLKHHRTRYVFGDSLWHRQMFRYKARYFYNHELLASFRYYMRVDPGSHFGCKISRYDPILYMALSKKRFAFTSVAQESLLAIPGLWNRTVTFMQQNSLPLSPFFRESFYDGHKADANGVYFDNSFQIADLDLFRSDIYGKYMSVLDDCRGFFYERFGDGIIHSIAAAMLLEPNEIHHFADISAYHNGIGTCPKSRDPNFKDFQDMCWCKRDKTWADQWYWQIQITRLLASLNHFSVIRTNYL